MISRTFSRRNDERFPCEWLLYLLPALLVGAFVRGIFLVGWKDGYYFGPDSESYWKAVFRFFHRGGFEISAKRSWGYPTLLLASPFGPLSPAWTAAFLQHFIGWAALFPLGAIVRRLVPEWRWLLIPVTVVYALDPFLVFWEHIMIADSLLVTFSVLIAWAAVVYWEKPSWKILFLLLVLIFFSMSVRPVGRALWAGLLPVILLAPGLSGKKRLARLAVALLFIFPAIALTKVRQGEDLLFGSIFPFISTSGGPQDALEKEISPMIATGRANLWQFVRRGQKEVFVITFGNTHHRAVGPELGALIDDPKAFAQVRHALSREAILHHPLGFLQITLLKIYAVCANDLKALRLQPPRYVGSETKFLLQGNRRIDPKFAAWFLGDARATNDAGVRAVLTERTEPGVLGSFYLRIFPKLDKIYHLYHLKDTAQLPLPGAVWPLILFLFGLGGWFALHCGSNLFPIISLNAAYLLLTFAVGRAVQRYRLPAEYFLILGVFLGIYVLWKILENVLSRPAKGYFS